MRPVQLFDNTNDILFPINTVNTVDPVQARLIAPAALPLPARAGGLHRPHT
jgi:hypothetical protein